MNAVEAESQALLPQRASAPASTWVRKTIVGACVLSGCAVAAVVVTGGVPGTSLANTRTPLGDAKPLPLSPRQRARLQTRIARARMGQTMVDAEKIEAPIFDELEPLQQFNTVGDGGVDGSDFHHQNIFHEYPGFEGCETECEGDHVTFDMCRAKYYCEWDVGRCWSAVGPDPCPASQQAMYDMWEEHYDDYETGLHHWLDGFPASFDNYVYPGTIGCEATCEGINIDEATCGTMFFCEWDEGKCWSAVGPNECPKTVHDMHELWYEYVHKHVEPDGIPPPPTPSPLPVFTATPTPAATPEPRPTMSITPRPTANFDAAGRLVVVPTPTLFDAVGHPTAAPTTTYDGNGNVVVTPTPTYYDANGHEVVPEPTPVPVLYDAQGHPTAEPTAKVDSSGRVVATPVPTYYDAEGHVVPTPTPQYFDVSGNLVAAPTTTYDANGNVLATPTPVFYDNKGEPVPTPTPLFYDVRGNPVSVAPVAVATATAMPSVMFDAAGHPTATPTPPFTARPTATVTYDPAGPAPTPTSTPTAAAKEKEDESLPGHHHEHFDHEYPGTEGCEAICEGHGFGEEECNAMFFCEFADGRCYSALGPNPCPNTEAELEDAWKDFDADYETASNATLEHLNKPDENLYGTLYEHPTFHGNWVGYPGTRGCEAVCEGVDVNEQACAGMFYCVWDEGRCYSGVGPNPCPNTQEELETALKELHADYEPGSKPTLESPGELDENGTPENPNKPDENLYGTLYEHPSFDGNWVGYPGTRGCEAVCEGVDVDEQACAGMFYCVWDEGRCYSGVGPNPCPLSEQEMREALAHEPDVP